MGISPAGGQLDGPGGACFQPPAWRDAQVRPGQPNASSGAERGGAGAREGGACGPTAGGIGGTRALTTDALPRPDRPSLGKYIQVSKRPRRDWMVAPWTRVEPPVPITSASTTLGEAPRRTTRTPT